MSLIARLIKRAKEDPFFFVGVLFLVLIILTAIFGPAIRAAQLGGGKAGFDSITTSVSRPFEGVSLAFPFGTDEIGRDIFARVAGGARFSLIVAVVVQLISLSVGVVMGVIGVFAPSYVSSPLMRFTDGMFAFPDILLAMLIVGIRGPGFESVIVALSITSWPSITRLVKTQMASLKDREYVVAARACGASTSYLVSRHILPQLVGILLAVSIVDMAGTILAESTLSFLGIGIQSPNPSWGSMIDHFRSDMNSHPIALIWPCLVLSLTIFAMNFVGDGLRSILDPKG